MSGIGYEKPGSSSKKKKDDKEYVFLIVVLGRAQKYDSEINIYPELKS